MQSRCSHCGSPIQRQAKGYKRKSLLTVVDLKSAKKLFPDLNPKEAFLCFACVRNVYQKTKKCGKRRTYVDLNPAPLTRPVPSDPGEPPPPPPPPKKPQKRLRAALNEHDYASQDPAPFPRSDPPPARGVRLGPMSQVCGYLRKKSFTSALNRLLQVSGFKAALIKVCRKIISHERKEMVNDLEGPYRKTFSPENLSAFGWEKTTSWAEEKAPLTVACLRSLFPPAKKIQRQTVNYSPGNKPRRMTDEEVKRMLDRRMSLVLSVPLYTSTLRACFLQCVIEFGKGSFTKQQVEQSAQLAGAQAKHLDGLFFTGGNPRNLSAYLSRVTSSSCRRTEDVSRFVREFKTDELFRFKPGRKHQGFDQFSYEQRVKDPERMGRRRRSLCEELDRRRDTSNS